MQCRDLLQYQECRFTSIGDVSNSYINIVMLGKRGGGGGWASANY